MAFDPRGGPLSLADRQALAERWIDDETAAEAMLRRVNSLDGGALVGRNGAGNWAGIAIPNVFPGADYIREYRLRRDEPEVELGKVRRKYMQPAGRRALVYFPVGTDPGWLADPGMPLVITEGEFKAIALMRLARHNFLDPSKPLEIPRWLVCGLPGVNNYHSKIGRELQPDGSWKDVTGWHPDLEHVRLDERVALVVFDADVEVKDQVWWAQLGLTRDLRARGAQPAGFVWPPDAPPQAKGIDDLLAHWGAERVLEAIAAAVGAAGAPADLVPYHCSDDGNAARLVTMHGANLRWSPPLRRWFVWNARFWALDARNGARKLMRDTMALCEKQAKKQANELVQKFAHLSRNSKGINPALSFAGDDLPIMPDEMDRDDHLLNFRNGTVDLRTGALRAHRRTDYITRMVDCDYNPAAECPRFMRTLDEIFGGGPDASEGDLAKADEKIDFFHRALGSSCTGDVRDKAIVLCHGEGNNGKTMLLSVVRELLAGYATSIPLDVLTAKTDDNAISDARATLRDMRFVMTSETEEGVKLTVSRLKQLCQGPGGEISARRLYESVIKFRETHKLWIDANHQPELPATDNAIWNRLHLIPFTVIFPLDRQDPELRSKLLAEREGIMAWLVAGAIKWYALRLPKSQVVSDATAEWRSESDRVQVFLQERTERAAGPEAWLHKQVLYKTYRDWCADKGERSVLSDKAFTKHLRAMKSGPEGLYGEGRNNKGVTWTGIRFLSD